MPAVRRNEGCHCPKVDSKSSLSTFARICSTKREPRGTFKVLCLISEGLACDAATITQGLPPLCLCNGQMDRLPRPCDARAVKHEDLTDRKRLLCVPARTLLVICCGFRNNFHSLF